MIGGHFMISTFRLFAAGAVALSVTLPAAAQTEWKFNNSYAPSRTESAFIREFVENVNKNAAGKLKINLLEGGAMGLKDVDALRWMQDGTPEMGFIWPPFLGRDAPDLASVYVYGSVTGAEEHLKALPAVKEILAEGMRKHKIEPIGFMGLSILNGTIFCRQPVTSLADLKKYKLRVGTREQIETFKALGVAAQTVAQQELYSAMQTGVIDCALYPARIVHTISLQEVAKHAIDTGFPFPPAPYVMMAHQAKWAALPADVKDSVRSAIAELEKKSFDFSGDVKGEAEAREKLRAQGVTFHPDMSDADKKTIRAAALKTWETIAKESNGSQNRARILQALGLGN
jgi:TRAP-type C4-dicarboxylate transport system substrate-binding protein